MSPAEDTQEAGRKGAYRAKLWLEATTRVEVPWVVYENSAHLRFRRPDGSEKRFDLGGHFRGRDTRPFFAEVKNYRTEGSQAADYIRYLADCYCATLHFGDDRRTEFMWITWHPFSATKWAHLCGDWSTVRSAVDANVEWLDDEPIDDELCRIVAKRLWLVVLSERQRRELVPTPEMIAHVRAIEVERDMSRDV